MKNVVCLFFFIGMLFTGNAIGAVTVSQVDGSVLKGSVLNITGTGFGARSDNGGGESYLNRFWDDFEDGNFSGWSFWGDGSSWELTSSLKRPNSSFSVHKKNINPLDAMVLNVTSSPKYFASFFIYLPSSYLPNGNDKYFRMGSTASNANVVWGNGHLTLEFSPCGISSKSYGTIPSKNTWHFVEIISSIPVLGSSENFVKVYVDGILFNETQCADAWPTEEMNKSPYLSIGTWFNSTGGIGDGWYFDDFYADYTHARVVLGDRPTFVDSTHREMQIPVSWATNQVQIQFNPGSFKSGDTAYLFVLDADGNPSNGYPITIGNSILADPVTPTLEPAQNLRDIPAQ